MNKNLVCDLKNLGIKKGDTILMHSSLKGLNTNITPKEIIDSVLEALGEEGTLIMPAFSYKTVYDEDPNFDVRQSKSCIGAIPEYFRTNYDVIRSLHPTHSVCAIGKNAKEITSKHHEDTTPVGKNSPIAKLSEFNGKILMLGCGLRSSTFMHGVEEIAGASYCLRDDVVKYYIKDYDDNTIEMDYLRHNFKGYVQRYDRLADILPNTVLMQGKLLNGTGHIIIPKLAVPLAVNKIKQEDLFFVDEYTAQE